MRDLFRSFDREGVRYLLIGGQAAVLYGAAQFTQDMDLWIAPAPANVHAFLRSLARLDARVHRLTPPPTAALVRAGHGFHFVLPCPGPGPLFLDAMGCPPRAASFTCASARAVVQTTSWGKIRLASIPDLIELKKTNRMADYDVISRLCRIWLAERDRVTSTMLTWAFENLFRPEDLWSVVAEYHDRLRPPLSQHPLVRIVLRTGPRSPDQAPRALAELADKLQSRVAALIRAGRDYWLPRIAELRRMRSSGALVPQGTPVSALLSRMEGR